ncbi:MAG: peptidoglycan editing factor PgeF [Gomphosphaeria aponina SAG 52.96 = DSM 107014]|uniref:Purine nucleoside phosphorylase n=1 Tax=Gomphosphaeria aponina SAG 52.96 = DSM 107014 TaxID=1521640 RepID=A0A941GSS4_9CHRO|nr:peptidoglycan editing factor PgeF [Gomphosphaeria aponina SAG 52.96 = DSM 107014]
MPYLTCNLLQNWQHGFFTQQFDPRSPEELVQVLQPHAQVYRVQQVHSNRVVMPEEMGEEEQADGIITQESHQSVWVASADCTPILMGDVITGRVGAVHAGWRGTAKGIVKKAIAFFLSGGSLIENIRIALGPAISGTVYQVSEEVAAEVCAGLSTLETLQQLSHSPILDDPKPGKVRLDVRRVIYLQLEQIGITSAQITCAPYCTYQQDQYFFSYRRAQQKKVQWSGIVSKINP